MLQQDRLYIFGSGRAEAFGQELVGGMNKVKRVGLAGRGLLLVGLLGGLLTACAEGGATARPATTTSAGTTTGANPTATASPAATGPGATATGEAGAGNSPVAAVSATPLAASPGATTPVASGDIPRLNSQPATATPFKQNWRINLEGGSEPEVVGEAQGLAFVRTRQGGVFALDAKTGATVWKQVAPPLAGPPPPLPSLVSVTPNLVLVGDLNAEKLTAYEAKTGLKKWDFNLRFDAPQRDLGSRFVGGHLYDTTFVVAVSSKQDPFNPQAQTRQPEYLLVVGIEIETGKEVWNTITDAPGDNLGVQLGNVIFASKLLLLQSPDFTVTAVEGATGKGRWQSPALVPLRTYNPDLLFSIVPEAGQTHQPRLRRIDIETGKLLWEKTLPLSVVDDPYIAISPDERTAYLIVVVSATESFTAMVDLESNKAKWRNNTSNFGNYTLTASNAGVRLRNFGKPSGFVFLNRENPTPIGWAAGGIEMGEELESQDGLYATARDGKRGDLLYLIGLDKGQVKSASRTDLTTGKPFVGQNQLYLPATDTAGKPVVVTFAR